MTVEDRKYFSAITAVWQWNPIMAQVLGLPEEYPDPDHYGPDDEDYCEVCGETRELVRDKIRGAASRYRWYQTEEGGTDSEADVYFRLQAAKAAQRIAELVSSYPLWVA